MVTCLPDVITQSLRTQFKILFRIVLSTRDVETQRVPVDLIGNSVSIVDDGTPKILEIISLGVEIPSVTVGIF